ncbi:MAG: flagellar hook basal-body protein [Cyanobacteria bacterium]|nr:flagellar hook basal-body protein [Cyanobacteriota bacterium]
MLQHIMQLASTNGIKALEVLDQVTTNVANYNTTGYKARRFEQYLRPDGVISQTLRVDYTQGSVMVTKRELDIAVKGDGFIPVTQPDGTVAYTRDGSFAKNSQGFLVTNRGDLVGDGIQLPLQYQQILIQPDGAVQARIEGEQTPKLLGKIKLVTFANPEGLKMLGNNKLLATKESGDPSQIKSGFEIKQGCLERTNVNMFHQVDQMLRLNAQMISNLRIVKFSDDIYRQAVNLRQ